MEIAIVIGLVVLVIVFIAGTSRDRFGAGSPPTPNQAQRDCESAGAELLAMNAQVCEKEATVRATQAIQASANREFAQALAAAAALAVSAALVLAIPIVGPILSSTLATAATAAFLYADFLMGAAATAAQRAQQAEAFLVRARAEKQKAIDQIRKVCSAERAQTLIDGLPGCP